MEVTGDGGEGIYDFLYKLVLVGDATVGKTHLLSRYLKGRLPNTASATIGVEFGTRNVRLHDGKVVKAQIWDTAGQERYRAITSAHYRKAAGALLVYDVTRRPTFENCATWLQELREGAGPEVAVVLVGNKVDLPEQDEQCRVVAFEDAEAFAHGNGLLFYETSAVTAVNVSTVFQALFERIYEQNRAGQAPEPDSPN